MNHKAVELIGAPFDLGGRRLGSRLGPAALRIAGLQQALEHLGLVIRDRGDIATEIELTVEGGLRNFTPLLRTLNRVHEQVLSVCQSGGFPLMLGGEHSLSAGSVSAARKHFGANLALLWIDAHADINTPSTSSSGNAHGMPIAALLGLPSGTTGTRDQEWKQFTDLVATGLEASRVSWMALRDVDSGERNVIRQFANSLPLTMQDIDRYGIERCVERFDAWLVQQGSEYLWISFDVDALDPILAPGTGTAVRGGLSYREAHLMAELLFEKLSRPDCPYKLVGLDLVEVNPLTDTNNETARIAVEWLASLFGKTVLDPSH